MNATTPSMQRILIFLLLVALPALGKGSPVNGLATRLYGKLAQTRPDDSLFFSPYSISVALAMVAGGAKGETRAELLKVMGTTDPGNLPGLVKSKTFKEGNRVWLDQSFPVKPEYLAFTTRCGAPVARVDFQKKAAEACKAINAWVATQTAGKITSLVPETLPSSTRLVLCNAVYFKDAWREQFKENQTHPEPFYLIPKGQVEVPMMNMSEHLAYGQDAQVAVCELPYKGDFVMTLVLPRKNQGLPEVEKKLDPARYVRLLRKPEKVVLSLPRFTTRTKSDLKEPLQALGVKLAFGGGDFSGISPMPVQVDAALHEAVVDVNEIGTEAAAATSMMAGITSVEKMHRFNANHPFLYMIRHKPTGTIVFMGRYMKP